MTATAQTVDIPDPNLRAAIATQLGKPSDATITTTEIANLTYLPATESNISDLTGLEHATNLIWLRLDHNSISDISAVADLTNLTNLFLDRNNISDISSLAELTNLTGLSLSHNSITDISPLTPAETELLANYPNPFNPETWIPYRLAEDAFVTLTIYDLNGHVVRTLDVGHQVAAVYENQSKAIYWDGRNGVGEQVASGVYFYHLSAGRSGLSVPHRSDYSATRKMLILK